MNDVPKLIVMLTYNDHTVKNAFDIFKSCKNVKAEYWGFKEEGLPHDKMRELYSYMKDCGKKTVLEVVAYTEKECLEGAEMAVEYGVDILMGTIFSDSVNELCRKNGLKYMPFVGQVEERPSVLKGTAKEMIEEAKAYLKKGVYGFDLLGYRYTGEAFGLIKEFVSSVKAPVCVAGSINSFSRLDEILEISPYAFTIGSAFFENKFEGTFEEQINKVCEYISGVR